MDTLFLLAGVQYHLTSLHYAVPLALSFLVGFVFHKAFFSARKNDGMVARRVGKKGVDSKRRKELYPKNYPNGWFKLLDSNELKPGQTKYIAALGKDFAVFRGQDGTVGVLDAFCPHNGANLAIGGEVVDNCLQCPFHKWEFDTAGQCTKIPYLEKGQVPKQIRTTSYHFKEEHGMILYYHDSQNRPPPYGLPVLSDFGNFRYCGQYHQDISMHLVEFAENAADFQHFAPLHGQMSIPFTELAIPFIKIMHTASWEVSSDKETPHLSYFMDQAHLNIFGKDIPNTTANAKITFVGPGGLVIFEFFTPMGKIYLFQSHLPLEPLVTKVDFTWYAEKSMWRPLVWYVVGNWIAQWKRDILVWENKIYKAKPLLVKGDGPIMSLRKWLTQFYDENVSTKNNVDW